MCIQRNVSHLATIKRLGLGYTNTLFGFRKDHGPVFNHLCLMLQVMRHPTQADKNAPQAMLNVTR